MKRCIVDNEMRMFHLRGSIFILLSNTHNYTRMIPSFLLRKTHISLNVTFVWFRLVSIVIHPLSGAVSICLFNSVISVAENNYSFALFRTTKNYTCVHTAIATVNRIVCIVTNKIECSSICNSFFLVK